MGRIDLTGRHPSTQAAMRFFAWEHLPSHLQPFSEPFATLAERAVEALPDDPELTAALRKLREAKDCAVGLAAVTYQQRTEG